ncbi:sensor histidine kinase [Aquabacterium humicola]|uniref:sensor histidine kinase n=1 Tax=Aquabacterium humicola TaxID=3237377 RepID=UPI0025428A0D|nr:ATP-binding protein [Rubrivivax pictus]
MRSIESRIKWRLLLGSLGLSAVLGLTAWWWVGRQVRDLLDYQLEQVARTLVDHDFARAGMASQEDPAMHLAVVAWDDTGRLLYRSSPELELRFDAPPGFSRMDSGSQPDAVTLRVFTLRSGGRVIQVAQPLSLRQELAREAGLEILAPALAGLAALSLLIVVTVRRSLAPLRDLGEELTRRDAQSLAPIELPQAPGELQGALTTLNALLERLQASLTLHRQFIADAAHELRTPLAAVRVQADNVAHAADAQQREAAMTQLRGGIERLQRLVEQLLELARIESSSMQRRTRVELVQLARDCLVDLAAQAAVRRMELALDSRGEHWIDADPRAIRSLLDNLVGNALKHAPAGTGIVVTISGGPGGVALSVRDHGPGIDPGLRERMLERFHRGEGAAPGSGLGLAIAAEAARRHGARLELRAPENGPGLEARVLFAAGR